jgi:hypothetical protein
MEPVHDLKAQVLAWYALVDKIDGPSLEDLERRPVNEYAQVRMRNAVGTTITYSTYSLQHLRPIEQYVDVPFKDLTTEQKICILFNKPVPARAVQQVPYLTML